jgi:hypothetical protein
MDPPESDRKLEKPPAQKTESKHCYPHRRKPGRKKGSGFRPPLMGDLKNVHVPGKNNRMRYQEIFMMLLNPPYRLC